MTKLATTFLNLKNLNFSNYSANHEIPVTARIALYFSQEQGESAEFTCVNEHFPDGDWGK
jgi:predicted chitinase